MVRHADPLEALENAVVHHKAEMSPSLVARHATFTWLRRIVIAAGGLAVFVAGIGMLVALPGLSALAAPLCLYLVGWAALSSASRFARRWLAGSTLRAFERAQSVSALGSSGTSVAVSAVLTPAQKVLQARQRAAADKLDLQRAQKEARERSRGNADKDAVDFDDA